MAKKRAVKRKITEADPFGPDFTELAERSFNEAIDDVLERQRRNGQDSPCTVDGRLAVRKPDGRIVFKSEKTNG
jgi:predicted HicB family RNase H-like nuclease